MSHYYRLVKQQELERESGRGSHTWYRIRCRALGSLLEMGEGNNHKKRQRLLGQRIFF
jgi:hypothetical protein